MARVALAVLFLLGATSRVWTAWVARLTPNADYGIFVLMSRHIGEGRGIPVFTYGQAYMGSIEQIAGSALSRLSGGSPFAICLGTVLMGLPLFPLVYLFGKRAGGPVAGLLALTFFVAGPDILWLGSAMPYGSYMATLTFGVSVLLLAAALSDRVARRERVPGWIFWSAGLLAGLGWWTNQLVIVFFLASVLTVLPALRLEWIRRGVLPAALAFFIGSLPWWWWNFNHEWATFAFSDSLGVLRADQGFAFMGRLFADAYDWTRSGTPWDRIRLASMLALALISTVRGVSGFRAWPRLSGATVHRLSAFYVVTAMTAVFMSSNYARVEGAARYLAPLMPLMAVLCADGAATMLQRRGARVLGVALIVLALPTTWLRLSDQRRLLEWHQLAWNEGTSLIDRIGALPVDIVYADYRYHWLNMAANGRLTFVTPDRERYAPFVRLAALAERPAYLHDYGEISAFVAESRGRCRVTRFWDASVVHSFEAPCEAWTYARSDDLSVRGEPEGSDARALSDGNLATLWSADLSVTPEPGWTWRFKEPQRVVGLRLLSEHGYWPPRVWVDARTDGTEDWVEALVPTPTRMFFWTGGQPRFLTTQYYQEYRFEETVESVDELRVRMDRNERRARPVRVLEARVMVANAAGRTEAWPADAGERLLGWKAQRVYAPSRYSELLAAQTLDGLIPTGLKVSAPASVTRGMQAPARRETAAPSPVRVDRRTAFVMAPRDAPRSRKALAAASIAWVEKTLGSYVVLLADPPHLPPADAQNNRLYWTELGIFTYREDIGSHRSR